LNLLTAIRNRWHPLWHIRRTPWLYRLLDRLDFPVWIHLRSVGIHMRVMWFRDLPWVFTSLPKEPENDAVFERLCAIFQPKIFWDVGANLGWFTWLVNARSPLTRGLAIEALPANADLLAATIRRNRLPHIEVRRVAISDSGGESRLVVDRKSGATSQLSDLFHESNESAIARTYSLSEEITVATTTLDAILAAGEPLPDLLKLDIEHAELLALRGAEKLLDAGHTIIVFESFFPETNTLLRSKGYEVYAIDRQANHLAIPAALLERAQPILASLPKDRRLS
jgi:FkbM family methyltransferase